MKNKSIAKLLINDIIAPLIKLPFLIIRSTWRMFRTIYERLISKLRFSITFRIVSMYAIIITFILMLLSLGILGSGFAYITKSESDDLQSDYMMISSYLKDSQVVPQDKLNQLAQLSGTSITIFDEKRKAIFTTEKDPAAVAFITKNEYKANVVEQITENQIFIADASRPYSNIPRQVFNKYGFALVLNESIREGQNAKFVQIINKLPQETVYAGIFIITLIGLEIIFIITIVLIGYMASKRLLRPIYAMTDTVRNVTINQLDKRLDIRGSQNEFKDLAGTFNDMLDRLENSYEMQNRFVSDASHELRTPISVIQGYANLLDRWGKDDKQVLEEAVAAIKSESEAMKSLIEQLLFLARGDKGTQKIEKQDFNAQELLEEIIRETRMIDGSHEIICGRSENMIMNADRSLLKEAIRIFMDNSVKYTPEGGKIKLECYTEKDKVFIAIEDTGVGISKEDLPHIFDRFYRADKSRTKNTGGTGLGMAIAKWIIMKHNGGIRVESEINVGTKILITLDSKSKN